MHSKLTRWLREGIVLLLIGAVISLAVDYLRAPALPQNFSNTPLQTIDGRTIDLATMSQERPLLLYVWATWCGICRYTTPTVATLAENGGNVITVALRSGDNATLEKWQAHKKIALPIINDASGQLSRHWDVQVTPTLVVIYRGEVKSITSGWTSSWGMRLRLWMADARLI